MILELSTRDNITRPELTIKVFHVYTNARNIKTQSNIFFFYPVMTTARKESIFDRTFGNASKSIHDEYSRLFNSSKKQKKPKNKNYTGSSVPDDEIDAEHSAPKPTSITIHSSIYGDVDVPTDYSSYSALDKLKYANHVVLNRAEEVIHPITPWGAAEDLVHDADNAINSQGFQNAERGVEIFTVLVVFGIGYLLYQNSGTIKSLASQSLSAAKSAATTTARFTIPGAAAIV